MKGLPAAAGGMRLRSLMFPADANLLPGKYYIKKEAPNKFRIVIASVAKQSRLSVKLDRSGSPHPYGTRDDKLNQHFQKYCRVLLRPREGL